MNRTIAQCIALPSAMICAGLLTACGGSTTSAPAATVTVTSTSTPASTDPMATGQVSSDQASSDASTGIVGIPNNGLTTWTADYQGAHITIDLAHQATGGEADQIRTLATATKHKAPAIYWADVDNRQGSTGLNMYQVTGADADGNQFQSVDFDDVFQSWETPDQSNPTLDNKVIALSNKMHIWVVKGARTKVIIGFEKPLPSVATLQVSPAGGFDQVDATPAAS